MDYKTQEEYLVYLADELKYLKPKDAKQVIDFYQLKINNAIDYGESIDKILESLPSPEKVAEDAYLSHGFKYKELRMKKDKEHLIFTKIFSSIVVLLLIIGFVGLFTLIINGFGKMFNLFGKLTSLTNTLDKSISLVLTGCYIIVLIGIVLYVIDLFYFLIMTFVLKVINIKSEETRNKLMSFSITEKLNTAMKVKNFNLKFILGLAGVTVILMIASYATKGYVYRSMNSSPNNEVTYTLDPSIDTINFDATTLKLNVYSSETEESYYVYHYEFTNNLVKDLNNKTLNLNVPATSASDLFDLLKEPTQVVDIYLASNVSLKINAIHELDMTIKEVNLNDLSIESLKATTAIRKANINSISQVAYNNYLGLAESVIGCITHEATKGQFLIMENSSIQSVTSNNIGTIKFSDSIINELDLTNNSGTVTLDNVTLDTTKITNQIAICNITNSSLGNATLDFSSASKLLLETVKFKSSTLKLTNNSYLVTGPIEGELLDIDSNLSFIFIDEYTSESEPCNLTIKSEGSNSKIELTNSHISNLDLNEKLGYLVISDCKLSGNVVCEGTNTLEFTNNDGDILNLYLKDIGKNSDTTSWITLKADTKTNLTYKVMSWDAISASNFSADDNVTVDKSEAYANE